MNDTIKLEVAIEEVSSNEISDTDDRGGVRTTDIYCGDVVCGWKSD